jgi:amidohydrolase
MLDAASPVKPESWNALRHLRRQLHSYPELAYQEQRTSARIAAWLTALGIPVTTGIAGTGVVGLLQHGTSQHMIGLRADMDALAIQEMNGFSHRSQISGQMHACGHDGHVAMLLGAAKELAQNKGFNGKIALIFQPAEEGGAGAKAMLEAGLFEQYPVDSVYALHNWPELELGKFAVRPGGMMASSMVFRITMQGKGAHAATPHHSVDPIPALCSLVLALQTVVARQCNPSDSVVVSVTRLSAGEALNAIPMEANLQGTARFSSSTAMDTVKSAIHQCAHGVAQAHGAVAQIHIEVGYPATINTAPQAHDCQEVMTRLVGAANVLTDFPVNLTTEDFGYMLQAKPGCYGLIGTGADNSPSLHSAFYDFNDEVLPLGVRYWTELSRNLLKETP